MGLYLLQLMQAIVLIKAYRAASIRAAPAFLVISLRLCIFLLTQQWFGRSFNLDNFLRQDHNPVILCIKDILEALLLLLCQLLLQEEGELRHAIRVQCYRDHKNEADPSPCLLGEHVAGRQHKAVHVVVHVHERLPGDD